MHPVERFHVNSDFNFLNRGREERQVTQALTPGLTTAWSGTMLEQHPGVDPNHTNREETSLPQTAQMC